jgi:hypothetical protein
MRSVYRVPVNEDGIGGVKARLPVKGVRSSTSCHPERREGLREPNRISQYDQFSRRPSSPLDGLRRSFASTTPLRRSGDAGCVQAAAREVRPTSRFRHKTQSAELLDPVLAGGLLLGLLEGAAAGGLLGLLVGLGVPEPRARASVQAFEFGRTVVVVRAEGERLEEARNRLQAYGPYELELTEQQTVPTCE